MTKGISVSMFSKVILIGKTTCESFGMTFVSFNFNLNLSLDSLQCLYSSAFT